MHRHSRILCFAVFLSLGIANVFGAGFPVAWGTGGFGLTNPPSLNNVTAIGAGPYHNLAVLDNGTVTGWGDTTSGKTVPPPGLSGVVAVAGGANHSMALRNNGRVVAWGEGTATNALSLTDVRAIAAGEFHSLALRSNGVVVAWGGNNSGEATVPAGALSSVIAIAAGGNNSLALRANGTVVAWGRLNQTHVPGNLSGVIAIAAGNNFCMALLNNFTIRVWGNNPPAPPPHSGVVAIAAGDGHGMALRNDRTVFCWGENGLNQTVVPPGTSNVIAIAGGATHSLALRMHPPRLTAHPTPRAVLQGASTTFNATFTGSPPLSLQWRHNGTPIPGATSSSYTINNAQTNHIGNYSLLISNLVGTAVSTNAALAVNVPAFISQHPQNRQVAEGDPASFSVLAGGTGQLFYQWQKDGVNLSPGFSSTYSIQSVTPSHAGGYRVIVSNAFGVATSLVATLTVDPIPRITAQPQSQTVLVGANVTFSVAAQNATGYQWRKNGADIPGATGSSYAITSVRTNDAAGYSVMVSNSQGSVVSQTATLTVQTLSSATSIVVQWGENPVWNGFEEVDITVPSGLTDVLAIAAGSFHDLALLGNGRVFGWGDNMFGQASSPSNANFAAISAGMHHSVGLLSNGTVVAWGRNNLNQTNLPGALSSVVAVSAGANHTLALRANGTVAAWGDVTHGQSTVPANVTDVRAVSAGFEFSMALLSNGTMRSWGNNDFGQRIPPYPLSNLVAIAAGKYHTVGLRNDGRAFAWGQNTFQQTNVPPEATNIVAIAAGANHSLALRGDGQLFCWGQNNFLQLHIPDEAHPGIAAVAGGGHRSLVLKTKPLMIETPRRMANGNVVLRIRNQDQVPVRPSRASKIELYATADTRLPLSQWTKLNIPILAVAGAFQAEDPGPVPSPRFYAAFEKP